MTIQLGIRSKLIGILILATALPLLVALVALQTAGYRERVREKGNNYETEAALLADNLLAVAETRVNALRDLLRLRNLAAPLSKTNQQASALVPAELLLATAQVEALWSHPEQRRPWLVPILTNRLSLELQQFQRNHPAFAEILIADGNGRLAAATGLTTDFDQSDERWWQNGIALPPGEAWLEGLSFDESAQVFSFDIALAVRYRDAANSQPQGVVKAVLNAASLFSSIPFAPAEKAPIREVIRSDGHILLRLLDESFEPRSAAIPTRTIRRLNASTTGWLMAPMAEGDPHMIGHAPLQLTGVLTPEGKALGQTLFQVIVHQETAVVLAPIRNQILLLTTLGILGVLGCALAGLYVAQIKLVGPLETLRSAAHALASTVRHGAVSTGVPASEPQPTTTEQLSRLDHITTGDEIETLSRDFRQMAEQILRYQASLQDQVAEKTAEIQRDLDMAREFQEALLPTAYPEIPAPPATATLSFRFHHAYRPTFTVSGDFFDVIKLSSQRVALFVADVMGHGSRSALVTAIIRTLARELILTSKTPSEFLGRLNQQFQAVVEQTNQTVFATALFLVADSQACTVEFASAGHPGPLLLNRKTGATQRLCPKLQDNPALGLFPQADYTRFQHPLGPNEVLLLLTDGVLEAPNEDETKEFGLDRVQQLLTDNRQQPLGMLVDAILEAVDEFADHLPLPDDICLLAMETAAPPKISPGKGKTG